MSIYVRESNREKAADEATDQILQQSAELQMSNYLHCFISVVSNNEDYRTSIKLRVSYLIQYNHHIHSKM